MMLELPDEVFSAQIHLAGEFINFQFPVQGRIQSLLCAQPGIEVSHHLLFWAGGLRDYCQNFVDGSAHPQLVNDTGVRDLNAEHFEQLPHVLKELSERETD